MWTHRGWLRWSAGIEVRGASSLPQRFASLFIVVSSKCRSSPSLLYPFHFSLRFKTTETLLPQRSGASTFVTLPLLLPLVCRQKTLHRVTPKIRSQTAHDRAIRTPSNPTGRRVVCWRCRRSVLASVMSGVGEKSRSRSIDDGDKSASYRQPRFSSPFFSFLSVPFHFLFFMSTHSIEIHLHPSFPIHF
ncbi:hypothetical protein SCHPADRAFT_245273 [Schizopora paradoxa]|uniref:Uncharacterized protein n=1 Tax=Schizopora paradoxa TaxID=27342 RepID=A0A0H2SFI2_9AGAM|nr:hypothetical protein SCHPADRAFT_245273 [Schizopora paradoxa]